MDNFTGERSSSSVHTTFQMAEEIEMTYEVASFLPESEFGPPESLDTQAPPAKRPRLDLSYGHENQDIVTPACSNSSSNDMPNLNFPPQFMTPPFEPVTKRTHLSLDEDITPVEVDMHIEAEPVPAAELNAHKRARRFSPQPERGVKRSSNSLDSCPSEKSTHQCPKKFKATPASPKPTQIRLTHRFNIGAARPTDSSRAGSAVNFVAGPEYQTSYTTNLAFADNLRVEGNNAFSAKNYLVALELYTQAMLKYPTQPFPGFPHHPGFSATLANRASAHMALGNYKSGASDIQKSLEVVHLPPLLTHDIKNTLLKRLFRLARCHLALLDPQAARYALEHAWKPQSPISVQSNEPYYDDLQLLSSRANTVLQAERRLEQARLQVKWDQALDAVQVVEEEGAKWGFDWKAKQQLPGLWSFWKAEALARLGKPIEASEAVRKVMPLLPLRERLLIQALIAFSIGSPDEADRYMEQILRIDPNDKPICELSSRIKVILPQLLQIDSAISISPGAALALCEKLLPALTGQISSALRIHIWAVMCEELVKSHAMHKTLEICFQVIEAANEVLSQEIGFSMSSSDQVYPLHRPFVIRILLARARATAQAIPSLSRNRYAQISELLITHWPDVFLTERESILFEIRKSLEQKPPPETKQQKKTFSPEPKFSAIDSKGYYKILGLSFRATAADIRKAFRTLSLVHHPDKGGNTSLFQKVNQAHQVLSDPDSRKRYDEGISIQ